MAFFLQEVVSDRYAPGIVDIVKSASHKKNRVPMMAGFIAGGWMPSVTYTVVHVYVQAMPMLWLLAGAGLTFSGITVFTWAKVAFKIPAKALGFVVLLEGAMTFVPSPWIGLPSLGLLILINGLATGSNLVNDSRESRLLVRRKLHRR